MYSPGTLYRHYKWGLYEIVTLALDEATQTPVVVYRSLEEPENIWTRLLSVFIESVTREDGITEPRFARIPERGSIEGKISLLYVTHSSMTEAERISQELLQSKLIACVNYFPIESEYEWKGEMVRTKEVTTLFKTSIAQSEKAKAHIQSSHAYEIPCILTFEVSANAEYAAWIEQAVTS